jgi:CAAX prenyl protease-like protein
MSSTVPRRSARRSRSASSTRKEEAPVSRLGKPPPFLQTGNRGLSPVFVRAAPFGLFIFLIALQPLLERWIDPRWVVAWRGLAAAALLALLWPRYRELHAAPRLTLREWLVAGAVGVGVFAAWIGLDRGWMTFGSATAFVPLRPDGSLDPWLVSLRLFALVAVVPLMEELFWRSFLLRWIDRRDFLAADPRRASLFAIAATCALFASEHTLWLAGLVGGVAYTSLYVGIGNLRACVASHALTNGLLGAWILATHDWRFW